jgi:hypothetical protein
LWFRIELYMQRFLLVLCLLATGCGAKSAAEQSASAQRVYWDSESGTSVVADATDESPAVNPATGRRTLMPALYCPECSDWRPAPPLDEVQRNPKARMCGKCGWPLETDGPPPDSKAAVTPK